MARRRTADEAVGVLPEELAAGPWDLDRWAPTWPTGSSDPASARRHMAHVAWQQAGTQWSRENGHSWNGWVQMLPAEVRRRAWPRRLFTVSEGSFGG